MERDYEFEELRTMVQFFHPASDFDLMLRAVRLAKEAHAGIKRVDGQDYFNHPFAVARTCATYQMDDQSVAAALLHDVVEDADEPREQVVRRLKEVVGDQVTELVLGLTKLAEEGKRSYHQQKLMTLQWILRHAAQFNPRTLVVKIFDRYHNLQSLSVFRKEKQQRIAWETVRFYIPLARRLGLYEIARQMEDYAFRYIYPGEYQELAHALKDLTERTEEKHDQMIQEIEEELEARAVKSRVAILPKHLYEVGASLSVENLEADEIHRVPCFNLEVCVTNVGDCFLAMGAIHGRYSHLPWQIRDFIHNPKINGYQSLHSIILDPEGNRLTTLVRTEQMAEAGVLGAIPAIVDGRLASLEWLRSLVSDLQVARQDELLDLTRRLDFAEIDVFTPRGKLIKLPEGATALDFAYAVHSDVGHHARKALIDGHVSRLSTPLTSGQTVRAITAASAYPRVEWLRFARTNRARLKIRQWLRAESGRADFLGARFAMSLLGKLGFLVDLAEDRWDQAARRLGYDGASRMFADLHTGKLFYPYLVREAVVDSAPVELEQIVERLVEQKQLSRSWSLGRALEKKRTESVRSQVVKQLQKLIETRFPPSEFFQVADVPFPMPSARARCCSPAYGDEIVGLAIRARGVVVHRRDCDNIRRYREFDSPSLLKISWLKAPEQCRFVLQVSSRDRLGLAADLCVALTKLRASISSLDLRRHSPDNVRLVFKGEFMENRNRQDVIRAITRVEGVRRIQYHESERV